MRRIERVGLELEGGWDTRPPSGIKNDGSVDVCAAYMGEVVSPPLKPRKMPGWLRQNFTFMSR